MYMNHQTNSISKSELSPMSDNSLLHHPLLYYQPIEVTVSEVSPNDWIMQTVLSYFFPFKNQNCKVNLISIIMEVGL